MIATVWNKENTKITMPCPKDDAILPLSDIKVVDLMSWFHWHQAAIQRFI